MVPMPIVAQTELLAPTAISCGMDQRAAWAMQIELWITCPHQPRWDHYPDAEVARAYGVALVRLSQGKKEFRERGAEVLGGSEEVEA